MTTSHFLLAAGLALPSLAALAANSAIPERHPPDRYEKIPQDSPFTLATAPAPVAEKTEDWASNLYVGGVGKTYVNGKEEVFVGIKSREEQISFSLFGDQPGYDGISIGGIEWSDSIGKSKVTLKRGSEFATVKFDEAVIQTPVAEAVSRPQGANPGGPGTNARGVGRPQGSSSTVPRPTNVSPVLPQALPGGKPAGGGSNTNVPPETKHRVRVIKSTP